MLHTLRAFGRQLADGLARRFRYVVTDSIDGFGDDWLQATDSGEYIGRGSAYSYGAWFRAIQLVSSCVAKTNLKLWQRDNKGKWTPAQSHFAYKLLCGHGKPNDETLKYHFFQTLTAHAMGHGGGFAYIERNSLGQAVELLQLRPDRTFPIRENGRLMFVTSIGGDYGSAGAESRKLLAENVLHIHGLGWDGLTGYSVLELAARSIGAAIAKERFGARFFRNSATPGIVIKTPRKLSDHAMKHLKDSWESLRTGIDKAHKPIILEDEASAEAFTHNATDSQLLEAVQWDPVVIANFTGVPPFLLGVKGYQSNSTLETQSQNLLDFTIDPWFVPWEQELNDKLLRESEKAAESHQFEFERNDLIRVDSEKRAANHRSALGGYPWKKVSEVREDEGLDQEDDTDFIPSPLNMGGGGGAAGAAASGDNAGELASELAAIKSQLAELQQNSQQPSPPLTMKQRADAQRSAVRQLWIDTAGRMARRLITARSRNAALTHTSMMAEHGDVLRSAFTPLCELTNCEAGVNHAERLGSVIRHLWEQIQTNATPEATAQAVTDFAIGGQ